MDNDEEERLTEIADDGYPIEIYTDERIAEFLAENTLTPEERKQLEEKLRRLNQKDS